MSSGKWRPFCLGLNELKFYEFLLGFMGSNAPRDYMASVFFACVNGYVPHVTYIDMHI